MEKLKNTRILAAVGIVCLFLSVTCFPYLKFSMFGYSTSIKLWGYWEGKVIMVLIVANLLFIFRDYVEKYVPKMFDTRIGEKIKNANSKYSIIPTIGIVIFVIWLYNELDVDTSYLKYGLGFYFLWLGVICLVGHTFLYKKELPKSNSSQVLQENTYNTNYTGVQPTTQTQQNMNYTGVQQPTQTQQNMNYMGVQPTQTQQNMNYTGVQPTQTQQNMNYTGVQPTQTQQNMNYTEVQPTQTQQNMNYTQIQSKKICPGCGNQCVQNASICPVCGRTI